MNGTELPTHKIEVKETVRIRWNAETAEAILDQWRSSGQSLRCFSRDNGIGYQRLLAWRRKLNGKVSAGFVRIDVAGGGCDHRVEIDLADGRRVRFSAGTDPKYIRSLLRMIEG